MTAVLKILIHHFVLALPPHAFLIDNVYRVAALLVIQVAENGATHCGAWVIHDGVIKLAGDGEIEGVVAGEKPSSAASAFGFQRKTYAVSGTVHASQLLVSIGGDFVFAFFEKETILLFTANFSRFGTPIPNAD